MKIFFDTEFIDDGERIELLSIGLVREDGHTYYAEPEEADESLASEWVINNVLHNLTGPKLKRATIADDIVAFVGQAPEFWAYYSAYDWVALCQLYGPLVASPSGWPMFCRDFKQWLDDHDNPRMDPHEGAKHNALNDALWLKQNFERLHPATN